MRPWTQPVTMTLLALAPTVLVSVLASREARAEGCVPGAQVSCPCLNGGQGVQVCADGGDRYGACQCADKSSATAGPAESPKGSIHLATVSSPDSPPPSPPPTKGAAAAATNGSAAGASTRAGETTPPAQQPPRSDAAEGQPTRNQTAMNLGLGLTIFGGLAFPVGGLWFLSQESAGGFNGGCLNPPGPGLCAAAASVFALGGIALAIGVPLLVVNLTRPPPATATAATPGAPAWQPAAVVVDRSNVRVVWAF